MVVGAYQVDDIEITSLGLEGVILRDTFTTGRLGAEPGDPDIGSLGKGNRGDRKIIVPEPRGTALTVTALLTLLSLRRKLIA